ncbi:MAG TPA: hypothetical protein PLT65_05555 [Bacilli bacterium]|nr:hypothetical protein [Bacilli bacterium]
MYDFVLFTISKECLVDTISGERFISHAELRRNLGFKCRIPYNYQMKVIRELLDKEYLVVTKSPSCVLVHMKPSDVFYKIKQLEGK